MAKRGKKRGADDVLDPKLKPAPIIHYAGSPHLEGLECLFTGTLLPYQPRYSSIYLAKIMYLLENELNDSRLLTIFSYSQNWGSNIQKFKEDMTQAQASWKHQTFNRFIIPLVMSIIVDCGGPSQIRKLSEDERQKKWLDVYDKDPEKMVCGMFESVLSVLDSTHVFDRNIQKDLNPEDQRKMKATRTMFRTKYTFACELAYKYRIVKQLDSWEARWRGGQSYRYSKIRHFQDYFAAELENEDPLGPSWRAYARNTDVKDTIIPLAEFPVLPPISQARPLKATHSRKLRKLGENERFNVPDESPW
ncbi:hypothetical protein K491DRAFT_680247 [Lophiostoma macrostomum CBS 122681]|uniref:Uncharacterized protein n=1 Tax=Lophiostoma macrostomum CBS 122681 TaxID=1314788 RepID=A0A6A6T4P5_9PLEO|nr:hypothetical protein K491DRAFT_680247 [Lophiostoma macrostomum CBS 122681]